MKSEKKHKAYGFTLVECLVVVLILMVSICGILSFRYYAIKDAEQAETQLLAARAAVVLSEAWRASKGADDFDPTLQGFDEHFQVLPVTSYLFTGPGPGGSVLLGNYQILIEGRQYRASLMYQNLMDVPHTRMLHVILTWQDNGQTRQQFHLSTLSQT